MTSSLRWSGANDEVNGNGSRSDVERLVRPNAERAHQRRRLYVVTAAEQAECNCPDFCERDHEND